MNKPKNPIDVESYSALAVPHLQNIVKANASVMKKLASRLVGDVRVGKSLFVFGSGHSSIFPLELYHRAGGVHFVIPIVVDYLLPTAGPPVVRLLERTSGVVTSLLNRVEPRSGEMIWLCSQSGINSAIVDLALESKKRGLFSVAFTSRAHSSSVASRHTSGKKLFEVCDEVVDLGGFSGDAAIPISESTRVGPLSTLSATLLGHSILAAVAAELESSGTPCVYTSVNTPAGEERNHQLEAQAMKRDVLLR